MTIRFHQVTLVVSCTVLSLALNGTALAQFKPSINLANEKPGDPSKEAKRKETDEKYRETLKAIPDQPKKKADPWGSVRGPKMTVALRAARTKKPKVQIKRGQSGASHRLPRPLDGTFQ